MPIKEIDVNCKFRLTVIKVSIGFILVAMLSVYSLAKYLRRLIIVRLRRAAFVKN